MGYNPFLDQMNKNKYAYEYEYSLFYIKLQILKNSVSKINILVPKLHYIIILQIHNTYHNI